MNRLGFGWKLAGLTLVAEDTPPAGDRLVDGLDVGDQLRSIRVVLEQRAVEAITGADLDRVEAVEDVELGERQLGQAVEANRLTQHHAVEPPCPAAASGDRAELLADVDERVAIDVEQLGRERSGTDTGGVGLGDPDDPIDVARPETRADAGTAGGRVRRGHVGVGAVVEVEERGLGTFEQHVSTRRECTVEQTDRVGDIRGHTGAELPEVFDDLVDVERLASGLLDQRVLRERTLADQASESVGVEHITDADTDAARLVGVGRADPLERGADLVVAAHRLGDRVLRLMPREDQVRPARHLQLGTRVPTRFEHVDLGEERRQIDHDTVRDHRDHVFVQDAGGHELQCVPLAVDDDGVARVVAALVAHDVGVLLRQQVDDLGFALIAPLGSDDDGDGHARSPGW